MKIITSFGANTSFLLKLTSHRRVFLNKLGTLPLIKETFAFYGTRNLLPCSQKPATYLSTEVDQFRLRPRKCISWGHVRDRAVVNNRKIKSRNALTLCPATYACILTTSLLVCVLFLSCFHRCFFICSRSSLSFYSLFFHFVLPVFLFCFFFEFTLFYLLWFPSYSSFFILFSISFLVLLISFFHSICFSTLTL